MNLFLGALVIAVAVVAIARRVDVRLVLFVAALILGLLASNVWAIVIVFFETFANERFVVPICCAMGFAYTLRHTGCDQHLVHLLIKPLTKVRWALVPGTIVVGFVVNTPIISQTSTAASLGPVVIPILAAARLKPATIGAVLLLGCSVGGELLNPGAPELRTIVEESNKLLKKRQEQQATAGAAQQTTITEHDVVQRILPLDLLALAASTGLFWYMSRREEAAGPEEVEELLARKEEEGEANQFQVNYVKAMIPFVPLALLFITGPPLNLVKIPGHWLVRIPPMQTQAGQQFRELFLSNPQSGFPSAVPWMAAEATWQMQAELTGLYNSRLIGLAMLIGVIVAAAVAWREALQVPRKFFEGAGYAFATIVSLIVTARCFGEGIKQIGLAALLGKLIEAFPVLLIPLGAAMSVVFAVLSGSGMATTQSLFGFFAIPAFNENVDPTLVGAVVAIASAAGRTMSPVAAVCLFCATLTNTSSFELSKRVAIPLLGGVVAVVIAAFVMTMMN